MSFLRHFNVDWERDTKRVGTKNIFDLCQNDVVTGKNMFVIDAVSFIPWSVFSFCQGHYVGFTSSADAQRHSGGAV